MKKMTYFVMALALVLGFTQCKKEQTPANNETEGVFITLDVNGGNNSKVIVTPGYENPETHQVYAKVDFEDGDMIYVGYNGAYVGTLTYGGEESNKRFSGSVNIESYDGTKPLHFYFLGGLRFNPTIDGNTATVNIFDQTERYPVISYAPSRQSFTGEGHYSATLKNKVSIMKFNVDTPSTAAICITGMNNTVSVNFATPNGTDNGFSYSQTDGGLIKMHGVTTENTETWAVVLPQTPIAAGDAYTEDNAYTGTRPAIDGGIGSNQYLSAGVAITVNTFNPLATPLTLEAITGGTIVVNNPPSGMQYSLNGVVQEGEPTSITVSAGDKVAFYGNGTSITCYGENYTNISGGTAQVKVYGNIMSLVDEYNYASATTLADNAFFELFHENANLTDASGLLLPATTLANNCYYAMFYKCTSLTTAPALPAMTLANNCYSTMFYGCTSLTAAPTLPATTLADGCYGSMFFGCTNLSSITCLATEGINENYSTYNWVNGVASSGTFTRASGASVSEGSSASGATWPSGRDGIPYYWEVIPPVE